MAQLALVRHGESEWNAKNMWTGWVDEPLTLKGREEAKAAARELSGINWNLIYESDLLRAKQTTEIIRDDLHLKVPIVTTEALRERNYGIYTQRNKLEVKNELGEEAYRHLRRGWDFPIAEGESLKQVYERVIPYFEQEIKPKLSDGKNVIISAHGNSLRALIKYLENISDAGIESLELATGEVRQYKF